MWEKFPMQSDPTLILDLFVFRLSNAIWPHYDSGSQAAGDQDLNKEKTIWQVKSSGDLCF